MKYYMQPCIPSISATNNSVYITVIMETCHLATVESIKIIVGSHVQSGRTLKWTKKIMTDVHISMKILWPQELENLLVVVH